MTGTLKKWGNRVALRLPWAGAGQIHIHEGESHFSS